MNGLETLSVVFFSLCLLFGVFPGFCQENTWRQLEPLKSTRKQVERLIGKPIKHFKSFGIYANDPLSEYTVWYSKGHCKTEASETLYDVPAGLLTRLHITLRSERRLADFEKALETFTRKELDELKGFVFYYSADKSLTYKAYIEKDGSETLVSIAVQPGRDKQRLRCKGSGQSVRGPY